MGKAITIAKQEAGLPANDNSVLYLILQIFGFAIVNYALMQNEMNNIAQKKWDDRKRQIEALNNSC